MSNQKRLYDCASIGGPYVDAGLRHNQADAHYALVHSRLDVLADFAKGIPDWQDLSLLSFVTMIIESEGEELANRAAIMQWMKRKAAYDDKLASWIAAKMEKGDDWRGLPMTAPQRHLVADTARILEIEVPEGMDRGGASDWLEANGAHVIHRFGEDD